MPTHYDNSKLKLMYACVINKWAESNLGLTNLEFLINFKQLKYLDLSRCKMWYNHYMVNVCKLKTLTHLDLSTRPLTDYALKHIEKLTELCNLRMHGCYNLYGEGLVYISKLKKLKNLNLSYCIMCHIDFLKYVGKIAGLERLNLIEFGKDVIDTGLKHLRELTKLQWLELNFKDDWKICLIKNEESAIECLGKMVSVEYLSLVDCRNNGLDNLMINLRKLQLMCCDVLTNDDLKNLVVLEKLECLQLVKCKLLTNESLINVKKIKSLTELVLDECESFTEDGMVHVAKMINLQKLKLVNCFNLDDDSLKHISKMNNLRELCLAKNEWLTNSGLKYLNGIISLIYLNISNCCNVKYYNLKFGEGIFVDIWD